MKNFILTVITAITALFITTKTSAQANTTLSNLVSPTKVNTSLSPGTNATYDLGSGSFGWHALYLNGYVYLGGKHFITTPGSSNNFIGTNAGLSIRSGFNNLGLGANALYSDTSGSSNTAAGTSALLSNLSGSYNSAFGAYALSTTYASYYNTAMGFSALSSNGGSYNTATGTYAMGYNGTGSYNTANGYGALLYNTTGAVNNATGYYALSSNSGGSDNTADGPYALNLNSTGNYNTAVGYSALYHNTASYYNTAVGYNAGTAYNNGYNNVFLGANTDVNGIGYYNVIAIGQATVCTGSSQVTIGNGATGSYRAYANWTNISDGRVKKNIKQNVPGLSFINKLQPVTYNLDLDAVDRIIQAPARKDSSGKIIEKSAIEITARKEKEQVIYSGFVAQDVEKAAKSMNYDFSGVDAAKNEKDVYGLRYAEFVVPLVKSVQELSKINDEKDVKLDDMQKQINDLKAMLLSMKNGTSISDINQLQGASLSQNTPNPFSSGTSIHYNLPQTFSSARIIITDAKGTLLKQYSLSNGSGNILVDASTLASGAYSYTLYLNGRMVDTKQMVAAK
jgi:hypothetical protein